VEPDHLKVLLHYVPPTGIESTIKAISARENRYLFGFSVRFSYMKNLPPLAALRSFEAVARLGSVSLAAAELNVTHSAVSQQIRLLEEQLGSVLFLREGRGLQPSEDGRLYALQVRVALGELSEATRLVRARPRGDELVIAVLPSFGQHWLLPRLPRFYARHPRYRVTLRASLDIQDLQQGLVDIGIRMGRGGWEGVQQQRLFDDELLVVAAPHFNGGRLPRTAAEVVACPVVRTVESWLGWCSAAGVAEPAHAALWINDSSGAGGGTAGTGRGAAAQPGGARAASWCS
jgi:LysR family glycine cleavage system transcriptional activator